jgi:hypothetical protein
MLSISSGHSIVRYVLFARQNRHGGILSEFNVAGFFFHRIDLSMFYQCNLSVSFFSLCFCLRDRCSALLDQSANRSMVCNSIYLYFYDLLNYFLDV